MTAHSAAPWPLGGVWLRVSRRYTARSWEESCWRGTDGTSSVRDPPAARVTHHCSLHSASTICWERWPCCRWCPRCYASHYNCFSSWCCVAAFHSVMVLVNTRRWITVVWGWGRLSLTVNATAVDVISEISCCCSCCDIIFLMWTYTAIGLWYLHQWMISLHST